PPTDCSLILNRILAILAVLVFMRRIKNANAVQYPRYWGSEKTSAQAASFLPSLAVWQRWSSFILSGGRLEPLPRFLVARPESQLESNGTASMELAGARQVASLDLESLRIGH